MALTNNRSAFDGTAPSTHVSEAIGDTLRDLLGSMVVHPARPSIADINVIMSETNCDATTNRMQYRVAALMMHGEALPGKPIAIPLLVENLGGLPLPSSGPCLIAFSCRWFDASGRHIPGDFALTKLPFAIPPRYLALMSLTVMTPKRIGKYKCEVILSARSGLCYQESDQRNQRPVISIEIVAASLDASSAVTSRGTEPAELGVLLIDSVHFGEHLRSGLTSDFDESSAFSEIYSLCRSSTMTSQARMYSMFQAVSHVERSSIPGDIVECGVWRGGACMLAAHTLIRLGKRDRRIYLYDTFAGMSRPTGKDIRYDGVSAIDLWLGRSRGRLWCSASLSEVQQSMFLTGYPKERIRFVVGKVENTIPRTIPKRIAVLRLDTDFYSSTLHEMEHLFPRLQRGGVLIVDDYGWWTGCRRAVDEYLLKHHVSILLCRIDADGARMGVKN